MRIRSFQLLGFVFLFSTLQLAAAPTKVGLVLGKGGKDDKSFNAAAYKGATEAEKKLGISLKTVEAGDDSAVEASLRTFANRGFDLIIAIGFIAKAAIEKVGKDFPKQHFAVVDTVVDLPNVQSITFEEQEGSYLVGALAALTSQTKTIGFIGGMDIPLVRRFELGYKAGAEATVPGTKVISNFIGSSGDAWKNPTKAKELALNQYQKKADVIFHVAGASGLGLFDAAEEVGKFAIGVDSDQNWIKPGRVLSSMVKRVDTGVYEAMEQQSKGAFQPGHRTLDLEKGGVDFALDDFNRKLIPPNILKKVQELKEKIIKKTILVPDYYKIKTATK